MTSSSFLGRPVLIVLAYAPGREVPQTAARLAALVAEHIALKPTRSFSSTARGGTTKPQPVKLDAIEKLAAAALAKHVYLFVKFGPKLELMFDATDVRLEIARTALAGTAFRTQLSSCLRTACNELGMTFKSSHLTSADEDTETTNAVVEITADLPG